MNFQVFFTLALISSTITSEYTKKLRDYHIHQLAKDNLDLQLLETPIIVRVYHGRLSLLSKCGICSVLPNSTQCSHVVKCGPRYNKLFKYVETILKRDYKKVLEAPEHNFVLFGIGDSLTLTYLKENLSSKPAAKRHH